MTVYQDQIWVKSLCHLKERAVLQQLACIKTPNVEVQLIDTHTVGETPGVVYITDCVMGGEHVAVYPEFWGIYSYQPEYAIREPSRWFNCFINRICPNRQSWFYQLIRRGLLERGFVSYRVDASRTPYSHYSDPVVINDMIFADYNQIFNTEHASIRLQVPYHNFDQDLDQCTVDSKVSLVLETYFDNPNISFTEKTFRALQLPRPFLIYHFPGAVAILRNHGFDVWDDWVDHAYDHVGPDRQREQMILDELERMGGQEFSQQDLLAFEARAAQNRDLLRDLQDRLPAKLRAVLERFAG